MIARVILSGALLLCAACPASNPAPPRASTTGTADPERGGILRVALAGDLDSLDPHGAARPSSWFFARAIHRGLLGFPAAPLPHGARPAPDLATEAPGARGSFTLRLRRGVRFADGSVITPGDVVASIARLKETGRGIAPSLRGVRVGALSGGRIRFTGGGADLPWLLAHPQAAIVPAATRPWGRVSARSVTGAGPYRVESHRVERRIVLVRNDHWRVEDDPLRGGYVDGIDAQIGAARADDGAVSTDGVDLVADPGPPDLRPPVTEADRIVTVSTACVRYLFMNTSVEPFGDRRARRAVASAVSRARLPGVGSDSPQAVRILPPVVTGHSGDPVIPESVPAARRFLREAGHPRGFRTTLVVGDSPRDGAEARAIRDALRRAGIGVRIRTVHPSSLHPDHYESPAARTPMGIGTWCADWPGLAGRGMLRPLASSTAPRSTRYSGFTSRRVDDLLAEAGASADGWRAADRAITSSAAIVPLVWPNEVSVLGSRVQGWSNAPMFPRGDPATLWLAPAG